MNIEEILSKSPNDVVTELKKKSVTVPSWSQLEKEYSPKKHSVFTDKSYQDIVNEDGSIDKVTRVSLGYQKLAVKRMTEMVCAIPIKRDYSFIKELEEKQRVVKSVIEKIYLKNRIDSLNVNRLRALFASCETATLWFFTEEENFYYGVDSKIKLRCREYNPMSGYSIYPYFDKYTGDLLALSFSIIIKEDKDNVEYFDVYTKDKHIQYRGIGKEYTVIVSENIIIGKIPAVYCMRPEPIWEDTSDSVSEIEWSLSRNGNYLRRNSKPIFCVFEDNKVAFGKEKNEKNEFRTIEQFSKGASAQYITWEQAVDNLKFHTRELRSLFFTQLQIPDWSYENMRSAPLSGEAMKQMFIDSDLKVKDESGAILEMLDREVNVIKQFVKIMLGKDYYEAIDSLDVNSVITPFRLSDEKERINNLTTACGKPIMSQREAVEAYGYSNDVDKTISEIIEESKTTELGLSVL